MKDGNLFSDDPWSHLRRTAGTGREQAQAGTFSEHLRIGFPDTTP
jgi:hypothetical protein